MLQANQRKKVAGKKSPQQKGLGPMGPVFNPNNQMLSVSQSHNTLVYKNMKR
jgi:hypothetical protein